MIFSAALSDNQIAIMGCFAALAACGLLGALTFHLGPAGRQDQTARTTLPLRERTEQKQQDRRAA
ncbi:MAG: hypothetical protein R3C49_25895 [Planctomycetaceae bacterium]